VKSEAKLKPEVKSKPDLRQLPEIEVPEDESVVPTQDDGTLALLMEIMKKILICSAFPRTSFRIRLRCCSTNTATRSRVFRGTWPAKKKKGWSGNV